MQARLQLDPCHLSNTGQTPFEDEIEVKTSEKPDQPAAWSYVHTLYLTRTLFVTSLSVDAFRDFLR